MFMSICMINCWLRKHEIEHISIKANKRNNGTHILNIDVLRDKTLYKETSTWKIISVFLLFKYEYYNNLQPFPHIL